MTNVGFSGSYLKLQMTSHQWAVLKNVMKHFKSHLTHKQLETHGCVFSSVAADALVLKHQAISIHSADLMFIVLWQFHTEILQLWGISLRNIILSWKKYRVISALSVLYDVNSSVLSKLYCKLSQWVHDRYILNLDYELITIICFDRLTFFPFCDNIKYLRTDNFAFCLD